MGHVKNSSIRSGSKLLAKHVDGPQSHYYVKRRLVTQLPQSGPQLLDNRFRPTELILVIDAGDVHKTSNIEIETEPSESYFKPIRP
jgi:hypothetical protein